MRQMVRWARMHQLVRMGLDFSIAMGVIWGVIWVLSLDGTKIHHGLTFLLFSLVVSSIAAFDLAFLRHLRRVYASPRRGVWRRV